MNNRNILLILLALLLVCFNRGVESATISDAISYLNTHQNPDGSFGNKTAFRDSCKVAETFLEMKQEGSCLTNLLNYIEATEVEGTDYLSRKIMAMCKAGRDTATLTTILHSYLNLYFYYIKNN